MLWASPGIFSTLATVFPHASWMCVVRGPYADQRVSAAGFAIHITLVTTLVTAQMMVSEAERKRHGGHTAQYPLHHVR